MSNPVVYLLPHVSEKTFKAAQGENIYTFNVSPAFNKIQIKEAIESQYKVTVEDIKTATVKGKPKNTPVRRSQPIKGRRSATKKAYVKLKSGDRIAVFEEQA